MSELKGKNIVGGNIQNVGTVAIGDGIVINNYTQGKKPREYLADLPPLPDDLPYPPEPYRGLRWFTRNEARVFFGRGDKIKALHDKLTQTGARPVTLLYGQSGVGKSSLLYAGLMPRLEANFSVHYLRRVQETGLVSPTQDILANHNKEGKPLIIILDQLEEIFTAPNLEVENEALSLAKLMVEATSVKWLLGFRKEYLAEFTELLTGANIAPNYVYLEPLQIANILEAVEGVSLDKGCQTQYNLVIDPEVAEAITYDIARDQDSHIAPALQVLLLKLWRIATGTPHGNAGLIKIIELLQWQGIEPNRDAPHLTQSHFDLLIAESGMLLDEYLGEQIQQVGEEQKEWVESGLLLSLLYYFTTDLGTARARQKDEINDYFGHAPALSNLLKTLQDRYILSDEDGEQKTNSLRLAHDALAPLIRLRFEQSQAPGPRAAAILENRLRNTKDPIAAPLDSTDLSLVLSGKQGMRAWTVEEEKLVSISKQRRNRTRGLRYLAVGLIATLTISLGYVGWRNYQGLQVQNAELLENEADRISDPTEQLITYYKSLQQHAGTIDRKDKFYTTYRDHLFPSSFIT
ncbi:MAG: ATP-binding protein, partial [Bacteroidota bacterium]